jgi:hypothetical protein
MPATTSDIYMQSSRSHRSEQTLAWPSNLSRESWDSDFQFWSLLINDYTRIAFAFDQDILTACSAIHLALKTHTVWSFVQGLLITLLKLSLLCTPARKSRRRHLPDVSDSPFPTWPWTDWHGSVGVRGFRSRLKAITLRTLRSESNGGAQTPQPTTKSTNPFASVILSLVGYVIPLDFRSLNTWYRARPAEAAIASQQIN